MKKTFKALFCLALAIAAVAGCSRTEKSPFVSGAPDQAALSSERPDKAGAYASIRPETVMMTVDGREVTWDRLFYQISQAADSLVQTAGEVEDWTATYSDGVSYGGYVLTSAAEQVLREEAVRHGAKLLGVALSEQDISEMQDDYASLAEQAGGEEELATQLKAEFCTKDIYMDSLETSYLARACFTAMYGESGSKLPDEDVAEYTAQDGYIMAKHILILTTATDEAGNRTQLPEEEKAKAKEKAEKILSELKSYKGDDGFDEYFDSLMNEYSEDEGGLAMFPNGYLFRSGDMVDNFEKAARELMVGQVSDVVETEYGYHIIYRIPIDYDATPIALSNYGDLSLRYLTALDMFQTVVDTWVDDLAVEYSGQYKALDLGRLLNGG